MPYPSDIAIWDLFTAAALIGILANPETGKRTEEYNASAALAIAEELMKQRHEMWSA